MARVVPHREAIRSHGHHPRWDDIRPVRPGRLVELRWHLASGQTVHRRPGEKNLRLLSFYLRACSMQVCAPTPPERSAHLHMLRAFRLPEERQQMKPDVLGHKANSHPFLPLESRICSEKDNELARARQLVQERAKQPVQRTLAPADPSTSRLHHPAR